MGDQDQPPTTVATVVDLMRDMRTVMVTTKAADGSLASRPMTVQEVTDDGDLWIIASHGSDMVSELQAAPRVNVAFSSTDEWVSLAGEARLVDDRPKVEELWDRPTDAWFEDGPHDPDVALVRVEGDSAQYWDTPGRVATMVSMLTASVTDDAPPDIGDDGEVEL